MNENRRFQESYLRLKTLHWRHACLTASARPCLPCHRCGRRLRWTGWLAGWLAGCLSCWGPLIMDLFEWIKTRPWLYKYPQIMCPIIVFASSKQRSSRWLQHGYFYTGRYLMSASKWALHVEGLDLTGKNSGIKAENTMLRNILVQQRSSKTAAFDFDTVIILSACSCYFSSHARMKCRLYVSGMSNSFYLYFSL